MPEFVRAQIGTCWWCGSAADSHEHKFKRTDIERAFGRGPYRDGRTLVKQGYGHRPSEMTGSKSKVFKFEPMICANCNGVRSQPFDTAYDQFMDYLFDNEAAVLRSGQVDLRAVYEHEWESKSLDLARYFAKHICCRLANVAEHREIWLDGRLIEFLDGGSYPRCLGLALLIDMSVAECWRAMRLLEEEPGAYGSFLHHTGLGGVPAPRPEPIENPEAGMLVGWFGMYWRVADDEYIPNPFAVPMTSLLVIVPTAAVATWTLRANAIGDIRLGGRLGLLGILGAVAGAAAALALSGELLRYAFALLLIIVGVRLLIDSRSSTAPRQTPEAGHPYPE